MVDHHVLSPTSTSADLSEALDAVDLLCETLIQAIGDREPTDLELAVMGVVVGLRSKHNRPSGILRGIHSGEIGHS